MAIRRAEMQRERVKERQVPWSGHGDALEPCDDGTEDGSSAHRAARDDCRYPHHKGSNTVTCDADLLEAKQGSDNRQDAHANVRVEPSFNLESAIESCKNGCVTQS